jgi:hypothetical protein
VPLLLLVLALPVIVLALMPLILFQRYRLGSARRLARPWINTITLVSMVFSAVFFLFAASVTQIWVSGAFPGAAVGVAVGSVVGVLGLLLTRWEAGLRTLHYTPNRWLVLVITLIVSARVLYGFYHSWVAARAGLAGTSMIDAFGVPESLGAGGIVIGYYLAYAAGLRWRIRRWERRPVRAM